MYDKKTMLCIVQMKTLKMALDYRLILEKVHMVIEFNEDAMLKPYIEMNTELRKKAKIYLEKELMKLKENSVLGKTMENIRNYIDIKLLTFGKRRNKLVFRA